MHLPSDQHEEASYIVFKKNGEVFVRDGDSGNIEFSGADAIQNALDSLPYGEHIHFKGNATYDVDSMFTGSSNRVTISGDSRRDTVLRATSGMDYILDYSEATIGEPPKYITITDLGFDMNRNARGGLTVEGTTTPFVSQNSIKRVEIWGPNETGTLEGLNTELGRNSYLNRSSRR